MVDNSTNVNNMKNNPSAQII